MIYHDDKLFLEKNRKKKIWKKYTFNDKQNFRHDKKIRMNHHRIKFCQTTYRKSYIKRNYFVNIF